MILQALLIKIFKYNFVILLLFCTQPLLCAQKAVQLKPDVVAILKAAEDFVKNYSYPPAVPLTKWDRILPPVTYYASTPIVAAQSALIQIPYRIFGLTAAEVIQILGGGVPAGIKTKVQNNTGSAFDLMKKLSTALLDLPELVTSTANFMLLAIDEKNMTPDLKNALEVVKKFVTRKTKFVSDFGQRLAVIMGDLQLALTMQNLASVKQTSPITDRHILYELYQVSIKIRPEFEALASTLGPVEPDLLNGLFNAVKAINFSKLHYPEIEKDVEQFTTQSRQIFATGK